MPQADDVLQYWLEGLDDGKTIDKNSSIVKKWFIKDRAVDQEIKERFEPVLMKARQGECKDWEESPFGRLALVILFDQFPRNIYRNNRRMFEFDPFALNLTLRCRDDGSDQDLQLVERIFLYMPLMHSEKLEVQKKSLEEFEDLLQQSATKSPQNAGYYEYTVGYAKRHHEIIAQFGRFPHRNAILSRPSTPEEEEFLKQPNSSF